MRRKEPTRRQAVFLVVGVDGFDFAAADVVVFEDVAEVEVVAEVAEVAGVVVVVVVVVVVCLSCWM